MANSKGAAAHRSDCQCRFCTSRRRKEEALTPGAGGVIAQEVIQAEAGLDHNERLHRDRVVRWHAIKNLEPEITNTDIAERMGIGRSTLQATLRKATREGWLKFDNPLDRIEHEIIPKVVDGLNHYLDIKDKTVILETAKGTIFKQFQAAQGITDGAQTMLAIKIEMPADGESRAMTGKILGTPKAYIDTTVIEED